MRRAGVTRALTALAAASVLLVAITACSSSDGVTDVANNPDQRYVGGGGNAWYPVDDRADAVEFATSTTEGDAVDTDALRGKVVVLNFWYASCPPCRTEAPLLNTVAGEYDDDQVVFLGVNVRDDAATARSFEKSFEVPYPTVIDADTGDVQLALAETVPANATPSTIVLDTEGRVAARVLGQLESAALLGGYIDAALEEQ